MAPPDLSGATLGRYRVGEPLGFGRATVVYRAVDERAGREVALKILAPDLARRPGFLDRLAGHTAAVAGLGDPRIVPVYEVAIRAELPYVTMRLVQGGSVGSLLAKGPLDPESAHRIIREVGDVLHRAHAAGIRHGNLKASNIFVEADGTVLVADFGQAVEGPSDAQALARLLLQMLAGDGAPEDPAPSAHAPGPLLRAALDDILYRVTTADADDRPGRVLALLDELGRVLTASPAGAPGRAGDQLTALIDASLEPVLAIDAGGRITHWNQPAEATFGWPRREVLGRPVLSTLIAPRYRELVERVLDALAARGEPLPGGEALEVGALHRDAHELTVEMSLSPVTTPGSTAIVAFCRDVSARREVERLMALRDAIDGLVAGAAPVPDLMRDLLETAGTALGWPAGAVWLSDGAGSQLRCHEFWHAPSVAGSELAALSRSTGYGPGVGLCGRAWSARQPAFLPDLTRIAESARERAALRAGLRAAVAVPIEGDGPDPLGVLEFFAPSAQALSPARMTEVEAAGRRLARALGRVGETGGLMRYKVDRMNTHLAFSCAFMKLLTVHGIFRDFRGWMEMDAADPATLRAECTIRTGSVDTGSLDRDYHLRSEDFFAVERYPTMTFRSTRVEPLGDERFRLFGTLTIRDVTRSIRLEVLLEERDTDALGVERLTLTAGTVINRLDWFLDWEKALQAGRWIVGDEVRLDLVITLVRRPGVREQVL